MQTVWKYSWVAGLLVAGCANPITPPNVARVAPGAFESSGDNDVAAINLSSWALADPSRTRNRPEDAARAVAAVDYLAGELPYSPRWTAMSVTTKSQMLQARGEIRALLGVAPGASSQAVVSALLTAANALHAGDRAAALQALSAPIFVKAPEQILAELENLPYLPLANVATQHASLETEPDDGPGA
jgi:hypothetical protein